MIITVIEKINKSVHKPDFALLLFRLTLGGLLLFHGVHKAIYGVDPIKHMLESSGLPGFIAYGVYLGELIAPVMIIIGVLCRIAALMILGTMFVAWLMVGVGQTFTVDALGAWGIESIAFYTLTSIAVFFAGCGRFSLISNQKLR